MTGGKEVQKEAAEPEVAELRWVGLLVDRSVEAVEDGSAGDQTDDNEEEEVLLCLSSAVRGLGVRVTEVDLRPWGVAGALAVEGMSGVAAECSATLALGLRCRGRGRRYFRVEVPVECEAAVTVSADCRVTLGPEGPLLTGALGLCLAAETGAPPTEVQAYSDMLWLRKRLVVKQRTQVRAEAGEGGRRERWGTASGAGW